MKSWQYYGLQSNIMIVCSLVSEWLPGQIVFMGLALLNMFLFWTTRNE